MDERHWRLLVRVFSGEASPAERDELRRWVAADPLRAGEVDSLRALWEATGTLPGGANEAAAWGRVAERTGIRGSVPAPTLRTHPPHRFGAPPSARASSWRGPAWRVAAMLVLLLGSALLWRPAGEVVRDHVLSRTVATGKGERIRLVLGDGSRVHLGVESRLRYPRRFGGGRRDVRLEGVAYFEVARDPRRPFRVFTSDAVTQVLGTRFTVRDYPGAERTRVAVTEGKVAVRPVRGEARRFIAILVGGQAAELAPAGAPAVTRSRPEPQELAWTQGTIAFHNASVPEVVAEIGRWYDVEIQVPDSALAARHLTISFRNEPLEVLLQEISAVLNARVERRGRILILTPASTARREMPGAGARNASL